MVGSVGEFGFAGRPALTEPRVAGLGAAADVVHAPDVVVRGRVDQAEAVGFGQPVGVGEAPEAGERATSSYVGDVGVGP